MSEIPQPTPIESNLPAPKVGMSYGSNHEIATLNFANGVTESGIITHVPNFTEEADKKGENKDSLAFEMGLIDEYKDTPMSSVLANSLEELKRFAGIGIPKYSNGKRQSSELDNVAEDLQGDDEFTQDIGSGFVEFGSTNSNNSRISLQLRPQQKNLPTQEEYSKMTPADQYNVSKGEFGELIAGDKLPPESRKMLDNLYKLTGAELVVDEPGERIYKGAYMGAEVYIEETESRFSWTDKGETQGYTVFGAQMLGSESGRSAVKNFSFNDIRQITKLGMDWRDLQDRGVTRATLKGYLGSMQEINALGGEFADLGEIDANIDTTMSNIDDTLNRFKELGIELKSEDGTDLGPRLAGNVAETTMDALANLNKPSSKHRSLRSRLGGTAMRFLRRPQ